MVVVVVSIVVVVEIAVLDVLLEDDVELVVEVVEPGSDVEVVDEDEVDVLLVVEVVEPGSDVEDEDEVDVLLVVEVDVVDVLVVPAAGSRLPLTPGSGALFMVDDPFFS